MDFRRVVKNRRMELRKSQGEMAKEMGISKRVYRRIESGNGNVEETTKMLGLLNMVQLYIAKETLIEVL